MKESPSRSHLPESPEIFTVNKGKLIRFLFKNHKRLGLDKDPVIHEAYLALRRAAINSVISIVDFLPVFGDAVSGAADVGKLIGKLSSGLKKKLDLTPDVSAKVAWGSEVIEPFTGGLASTHWIEGGLQLRHDWPKIKEGLLKVQAVYVQHHKVK